VLRKWMLRNCLSVTKRSLSRKVFLTWWAEASCTPTVVRLFVDARQRSQVGTSTYPTLKSVGCELALQAALYPRSETVKTASCERSMYHSIPGSQPAQNRAQKQIRRICQHDNRMWWGGGGSFYPFLWLVPAVAVGRLELDYGSDSFSLSAWARRQTNIPFKKAVGVLCGALLLSVWTCSHRHTQVTRACLSTSVVSFACCFYWKEAIAVIFMFMVLFYYFLHFRFLEGNVLCLVCL